MAHVISQLILWFFPTPVMPSLKGPQQGQKCKQNTILDMVLHLLANLCIILNFFFLLPIVIIVNILIHFPEIMKKIGFWPEGAVKIRNMTKQIMKERDEKDIKVGDFVDRLRDYKKVAKAPITGDMIEAQGMIFLLAGFETTASTLGKAMY